MNKRKAQCRESGMLRLAEGPTEKGYNRSTSLAAYSTTETGLWTRGKTKKAIWS